jgi:hypothetical protein
MFSCKQSISKLKDLGFVGKLKEKLVRLIVDEVLGEVKQDSAILALEFAGEFGEPIFVLSKQVLDDNGRCRRFVISFKLLPRRTGAVSG